MSKKVIAVVGSYRKGGIIDQTVDSILESAHRNGADIEKIYLIDRKIEFCTNCRSCMKDSSGQKRGKCIFSDDMDGILAAIDSADGLVLGSLVNFGTVTAIMKRFIERCAVYGYWPWSKPSPELRIKGGSKKAVLVTSSACPAFIAKILKPSSLDVMKKCVSVMGAKTIRSLYFGTVCRREKQKLNKNQIRLAELAGNMLVKEMNK